jgi:8-oxo-dGTP diphosphatase
MPDATVAAIIKYYDDDNRILIANRNHEPFKGYWCLPGGHIERYESVTDAIIREVKEETLLDFTGVFFDFFEEVFPAKNIHNIALVFVGKATGHLPDRTEEVNEFRWVTQSDAEIMNLAFRHNDVIRRYSSIVGR